MCPDRPLPPPPSFSTAARDQGAFVCLLTAAPASGSRLLTASLTFYRPHLDLGRPYLTPHPRVFPAPSAEFSRPPGSLSGGHHPDVLFPQPPPRAPLSPLQGPPRHGGLCLPGRRVTGRPSCPGGVGSHLPKLLVDLLHVRGPPGHRALRGLRRGAPALGLPAVLLAVRLLGVLSLRLVRESVVLQGGAVQPGRAVRAGSQVRGAARAPPPRARLTAGPAPTSWGLAERADACPCTLGVKEARLLV